MKDYIVNFTLFGFQKKEIVTSETIFKAEKIVKEKYGEENVKISSSASTNNVW